MRVYGTPLASGLKTTGNALDVHAIEDLEAGLNQSKNGHVVALVQPAEHIVATSLSQGMSPEEALAAWHNVAAVLIKRHRYYRSRTTFVDARYFGSQPKKVAKLLQDVLEIKLSAFSAEEPSPFPRIDPLFELVALGLLRHDTAAEKVRAFVDGSRECDAADSWLDKGAGLIEERQILRDTLDVAHTHIAAPDDDASTTSARAEQLKVECHLLSEDVDHMQQRLEREIANTKMLQLSKDAADKNLKKLANQIQHREVVLGQALLAEGRRHDAILTSLREEKIELLGKRDQLEQEVAERHAELQRVYASKSWRVTEPIRALRRSTSDS